MSTESSNMPMPEMAPEPAAAKGGRRSSCWMRGGSECETGAACSAALSAQSSLSQGEDFARMTKPYHGGRRTRRSRMRGGAGAEYNVAFEPAISADMHGNAGIANLDKAFMELPQVMKQGGGRSARKTRRGRKHGGMSPIDAPSMLISPQDEPAAFLNPQWYNENVVNPQFHGPDSTLVKAVGGARKSRKGRKASKKSRKASKKSRKTSRKGRKASKKSRKTSRKNSRK